VGGGNKNEGLREWRENSSDDFLKYNGHAKAYSRIFIILQHDEPWHHYPVIHKEIL